MTGVSKPLGSLGRKVGEGCYMKEFGVSPALSRGQMF